MNTPKNFYRYTVTSRLGVQQPKLLGENDFKIDWNREDEEKFTYKKELNGKTTIRGDLYNDLLLIERSEYRCEYVDFLVESRCVTGGVEIWSTFFTGRISLNDGTWDLDRCILETKIQFINPEQCFQDNKSVEVDLMAEITPRYRVLSLPAGTVIELKQFAKAYPAGTPWSACTELVWLDPGTPEAGHWTWYQRGYVSNGISFCAGATKWARYAVTVGCSDPSPGSEWFLISTSCPGVGKKYVKPVNVYDCVTTETGPHNAETICQIVGQGTNGIVDNGMALGDVLKAFTDKFCPGVTVVSDFFQINPETPSSTNYVTGVQTKTDKIIVFQKSDVKRPSATQNATKAVWTFEKCINAICKIFNCRWRVQGNTLRVEHVSFFPQNAGLDLTVDRYKKYMVGHKKYSYATEKIPVREEFKFMEASAGDFAGVPIYYEGACVSQEGRENVVTHTADDVTTDMELCFSNADADSNDVSDRGFVFVATHQVGSDLLIISEDNILTTGQRLNNSLAWSILHRDYHRHYRPLHTGNMNNVLTDFLSVRPTKKGKTVTVPLCCGDTFNPDDTIKTGLGDGIVEKASFSLKDNTVALDLLYSIDGLTENAVPVAVNDMAEVVKNTPEEIDVLANDTDDDEIVNVQVVGAPLHGTASVTIDNKILYSPATNYVGPDLFTYRVKDTWGSWSAPAIVTIDVVPPALSLEVVNDSYSTEQDTPLNILAAAGVLDNDSTVSGVLVVTAETKATAEGGSVEIFADGSFDYTPPLAFVGIDSFTYTVTNGTDTDEGNVEILVINTGEDHLQAENYSSQDDPIAISGWCVLENFTLCRTIAAKDDATAASESVTVTVEFMTNTGCSFSAFFDFLPTDLCAAPQSPAWCDGPPGCSSVEYNVTSITII